MYVPDIALGLPPLRRRSPKTGKPMKPILYVWCFCSCGSYHAAPLMAKGTIASGRCPLCGGKR